MRLLILAALLVIAGCLKPLEAPDSGEIRDVDYQGDTAPPGDDTGSTGDGVDDTGSPDDTDTPSDDTGPDDDLDGDGWSAADGDCDDGDASVHPGAAELCDGIDNDCDGVIDPPEADDAATWYFDGDGDGYGDDGASQTACDQPSGYVAYGGDCDDEDAAWNPGATEDDCADPHDYNCDGSTGYADGDGDGYAACDDCDDANSSLHPGADEICDGVDNDCDGVTDPDDSDDAESWYADLDGDGYADADTWTVSCEAPTGYVAAPSGSDWDCDDADAAVNPAADEYCEGAIDEDCDGSVDEDGALDAFTWYSDADSDGYGDASVYRDACYQPTGYVLTDADCDDGDAAVNPAADEVCNGIDDDCDGDVDPDTSLDAAEWYFDGDGDGYGDDGASQTACEQPSGYVAYGGDCDDGDAAYNPGATEDDCDSAIDYNCDGETGYADDDGDGFSACDDCDDGDADVNPDATETCNGVDDDCDGVTDPDSADGAGTWYADDDGDGYGDAGDTTIACADSGGGGPSGYLADDSDCDDADSDVHPGAAETCDGADEDCDGSVDEGATGDTTWYADDDGDGYGDPDAELSGCESATGYVADDSDCDDTDASINPDATEYCDGIDSDCDGDETDAGLVSFESASGGWADLTSDFAAGVDGSPTSYGLAAAGTLWVCEGTWYVSLEVKSVDVTIQGLNGESKDILSGGDAERVIYISGGSLTLQGVKLKDGYTDGDGGAIYASSTSVTMIDAKIDGAQADGKGGLIYGSSVSISITGKEIKKGQAGDTGGAIYLSSGSLVLDDTKVKESATRGEGGGIYLSSADLTATDSEISKNESSGAGAGIYLVSGSATLTDTKVKENESASYGGGMYVTSASLSMSGGECKENVAAYGGGFYVTSASLTLDDFEFEENVAASDDGGAGTIGSGGSATLTDIDWNKNDPYDLYASSGSSYSLSDGYSGYCSASSCSP